MSEGTGFNKSSVHRILAAFEASGYVAPNVLKAKVSLNNEASSS
ncbi:helix-turn-helix domain-containing protein [Vibrio chagasii]|nr:helix-turn-helix domain-containing protein [Vibrio chagasii]